MLFWFVAALLTVGASLAVLLPLASRSADESAGESNDLEVYRDQLAELDRDAARGLIRPDEAEQARTEIARRILLADSQARTSAGKTARGGSGLARLVGVAAILAVPLVSWGIYAGIGSPGPAVAAAGGAPGQKSGRQYHRRTGGAGRGASRRQPVRRPRLGRAGADLSAGSAATARR